MTPLDKAKKAAGSAKELARRIGVTPQAISQWDEVPLNRVLVVERETGISRHELRPDVFGLAPETVAA